MQTLFQPIVTTLLDELFRDAERTDAPLMAQLHAMPADERGALMADYKRLYGAAKDAYLPISRAAGVLLYTLARARDARLIVEFGTSFGVSTIFLAAALRDAGGGRLITSELEPSKAARAKANLERAGLADLVELRVGDALDTLADVRGPIDLVYLDGAKALYRPILDRLEPGLADRAVIVADNIDMVEQVESYTSHVRDPAQGYVSTRVNDLEISLRIR
ncbi:MAG: class I SAM-dependent methyltransferase [Deltaproteobacteria bacterium]|nr:class I SAM-dependent methyltransferase [Deltaproteobacteria bacterium]